MLTSYYKCYTCVLFMSISHDTVTTIYALLIPIHAIHT